MIAKLSDFFILLFSASVFGGLFLLFAEILYRTKTISAGGNYYLLRFVLIFHIISPIFAAAFFVWSAKPTVFFASGSELNRFTLTPLPISYHFYDFYSELHFFPYLFIIWLVGFLGAFLSRIHKNRRLFLQLKATCPANTNHELELLKNQLAEKHHIRKQVQIRHCALLNSPLISGISHPTIFLPKTKLPEQYTEFILRHELTHCHRNDIFYKYLLLFIKSLYWFSPIIHIFSHIFNERCEIACDEVLLDGYSRKEQLEYAKCIAGFAGYTQPDFTVSFYSSRTVEHRIASIAAMRSDARINRKKTVILTSVAILLLLTALMLTAANSTILRIALGKWMELLHTTSF